MLFFLLRPCSADAAVKDDRRRAPAQPGTGAGKKEAGKGEDGGKPVVYTELYSGEVTTLNYLVSASEADFKTAAYCIDTLIEYDSEGKIRPGQATEWNMMRLSRTWTFHLREAKWVDNTGAPVAIDGTGRRRH